MSNLLTYKTDLKSLKYSKDRPDAGYSGQPFIQKDIDKEPTNNSTEDFLLRGGLNAIPDALEDVGRLTKYFVNLKSPSGFLFIAKQNLLSKTSVKTQASSGVGYGGYSYYLWSQETIGTLRENNVKLKTAAETLQNTVNTMKADAEKNEKLNRDLSKRLQASNEHLNKLRGVFAKIDLTMEALTNAQGLEDRIDRAVGRLIDRIENETTPPSDEPADTSGVSEATGTGSSSND
jgi:hypothetical protein